MTIRPVDVCGERSVPFSLFAKSLGESISRADEEDRFTLGLFAEVRDGGEGERVGFEGQLRDGWHDNEAIRDTKSL